MDRSVAALTWATVGPVGPTRFSRSISWHHVSQNHMPPCTLACRGDATDGRCFPLTPASVAEFGGKDFTLGRTTVGPSNDTQPGSSSHVLHHDFNGFNDI